LEREKLAQKDRRLKRLREQLEKKDLELVELRVKLDQTRRVAYMPDLSFESLPVFLSLGEPSRARRG
jgi:hypothetical protein